MEIFLTVGIGVGFLGALGALVNIYPANDCLKWLQFWIGLILFLWCLGWLIRLRIKEPWKLFHNFLDLKIKEGEDFLKTYDDSFTLKQMEEYKEYINSWHYQIFRVFREVITDNPHSVDEWNIVGDFFQRSAPVGKLPKKELSDEIEALKKFKQIVKKSNLKIKYHISIFEENQNRR